MKMKKLLAIALLMPSLAMANKVENVYENKFIGDSDITVNRFTNDEGRFITCELALGAKTAGDPTVVIQGVDLEHMHFYSRINNKPSVNGWSFQLDNDRHKVELRGLMAVFHKNPVKVSPGQLNGIESASTIKIGVWDDDQEMQLNEFDLKRIGKAVNKFKDCMSKEEVSL